MGTSLLIGWVFALLPPLAVQPQSKPGVLRVHTSPAAGLGHEPGVARLNPSDVIPVGDQHVVVYSKLPAGNQLYPAPFTGEIWWASSTDKGHHWTERGLLLTATGGDRPDAKGVFDPDLLAVPGEGLFLFYSGIGNQFNFRFEHQGRPETTQLLVARLSWDSANQSLSANWTSPPNVILSPSTANPQSFDSRRVRHARPLLINGLVNLYYQGLSISEGTRGGALGLARGHATDLVFSRQHDGHEVLPFQGESLLEPYAGGVMATLTGAERGIWWAADGEHFAPLDVQIRGRLNSPGLYREPGKAWDGEQPRWGLHVALSAQDPYLERFELTLQGELGEVYSSSVPRPRDGEPSLASGDNDWKAKHLQMCEQVARQEPEFVFLGSDLVACFGGQRCGAPELGKAAWEELFGNSQVANLGLPGDTTANLLWRVDHGTLPGNAPAVILLQTGERQALSDGPLATAQGITTLVRHLQAKQPQARVLLLDLLASPSMGEQERAAITETNRFVRRLTRQPRVQFVELHDPFCDEQSQPSPELFDGAGEQLSAAGYARLASILRPLIE